MGHDPRNSGNGARPVVVLIADAAPAQGGIPRFVDMVLNDAALGERFQVKLLNTARQGVRAGGEVSLRNALRALIDSARTLRAARGAAVVHIQTALLPTAPLLRAAALCTAARLGGAAVLCHAHSGLADYGRFAPNALQRCLLRSIARTARFIAVSDAARRGLAAVVSPGRVSLIENAVDTEVPRATLQGEPPRICFVGTLTRAKGLLDLLDAVEILRRRGLCFELEIIGGGAHAGEQEAAVVRRAFTKAGLGGCLKGHLGATHVAARLAAADLFVLPSHSEGRPIALLEAMAAGLPSVVSDAGGMPELVRHGRDGIVVPAGDPGALARALEWLLRDAKLRARLGASARRRVEQRFGRSRLSQALAAVYLEELA